MEDLKPMLFTCLKKYSKEQFIKDLIAGIIVAIIALPLSIALALASGVGPERGIYTAVIAGFVISFLGGSQVQIAGPTAAFATIVAGIVADQGMDGLAVATILAGIILILMGFCRLGSLIKFIPYTITTGFTAGIAVTIAIGQLNWSHTDEISDEVRDAERARMRDIPSSISVCEITGPLFFGAADQIGLIAVTEKTKCLILRMRGVPALDSTAMNSLTSLYEKCRKKKITLILSHVNDQPMRVIRKAGFDTLIGKENFSPNIDAAIEKAEKITSNR